MFCCVHPKSRWDQQPLCGTSWIMTDEDRRSEHRVDPAFQERMDALLASHAQVKQSLQEAENDAGKMLSETEVLHNTGMPLPAIFQGKHSTRPTGQNR